MSSAPDEFGKQAETAGAGRRWEEPMEQSRAAEMAEPTPIFGAYRRGYDPDQVDRYVAEQQRRLDDSQVRASEAERKLASAVGQLRELHRRVGALEDNRSQPGQPIRFDGVGDHIQRMFEEARQGADALRSDTASELAELREKTITEARSIVAGARRKAEEIESETERRRREQLDRLEEDRSRAATQLSYLHEQRKNAVAELLRIREVIDSTIAEVSADLRPRSAPEEPTRNARPMPGASEPKPRSYSPRGRGCISSCRSANARDRPRDRIRDSTVRFRRTQLRYLPIGP